MKIAIDARWIFRENSGVGTYTRQLIEHLAMLDRENRYLLVFQDPALRDQILAAPALRATDRIETCRVSYGLFSPRNQAALLPLLARHQVDVYHSTNYMIPLYAPPAPTVRRIRLVATIHDIIPLALPNHAPRSRKSRMIGVFRWMIRRIVRKADAIVTVSHSSKNDLIRYGGATPDAQQKIKVVYNGVSPLFRPPASRQAHPDEKTLLYVGRQDPYKNLDGLIRIFAEIRQQTPHPLKLVIAGPPDPRYPEPFETARKLGVAHALVCTGPLPPARLVEQYQQADVLVHPSKYEGFGLQVLEAMACGLPVVCSRSSSLPEVGGDAALYAPPDEPAAFCRQIKAVLTQPDLAARLSAQGLEQAARFPWEKTARETRNVYTQLAAPNTGGRS